MPKSTPNDNNQPANEAIGRWIDACRIHGETSTDADAALLTVEAEVIKRRNGDA
ncbi:hypothetical protein [Streptomyces lydicus]|uniref:hypothetical protein n=1 Tax=Streptomyces lydicus TaxID=47763 RepID=UPI0036E9D4B6